MGFISISIEDYLDLHIKNNPDTNRASLKANLKKAHWDFKNGVRCECGNDIWVVGSAVMGNKCYTCITGEDDPKDNYEIEWALNKNTSNVDELPLHEIIYGGEGGFYNDDGTKLDPSKVIMPKKCLSCIHFKDPFQHVMCTMVRFDHVEGAEFSCGSYEKNEDKL